MLKYKEDIDQIFIGRWLGDEILMGEVPRDGDLMGVEEMARRLGLAQATVWRWCREGRLPCMKIGKSWRIRPEALEEFIRRSERPATLEGELGSFLRVPDNVLAIAQSSELLRRLDAAFLKVAEARDGLLIRFYDPEAVDEGELRSQLEDVGLDVKRLEREGRLYLEAELDSSEERVEELRYLSLERLESGRTLWITFDWPAWIGLETMLDQQRVLTEEIGSGNLVVMTSLLEEVTERWLPNMRRRMQAAHSGTIWLSEDGLVLSRVRRLSGLGDADARS